VSYDELMAITEVWVDTALGLGERSLKMMDRIVRAQERRSTQAVA
jgi:DSF synthase